MKISIFPQCKAIPESKEEKKKEAFKCSSPYLPSIVEVYSHEELMSILLHNAWSPSIFDGCRNNNNFISTNFMVLDIDEGLNIDQASDRCIKFNLDHIIMPTPSHKANNHRFRLIFPLAQTISNKNVFDSTWSYLGEIFPEIDKACKDYARFYFGGKREDSMYFDEGNLLEPIYPITHKHCNLDKQELMLTEDLENKLPLEIFYNIIPEKIPESIHYFINNAKTGMSGEWNNRLNACVFTLGLQGVSISNIINGLDGISPEELDEKDMSTIKASYKRSLEIKTETPIKKKHLI